MDRSDPSTGATLNLTNREGHDLRAVPFTRVEPMPWQRFALPDLFITDSIGVTDLEAGDIDGDDRIDLLVFNDLSVRVLRGVEGGFANDEALAVMGPIRGAGVADVTRDSIDDVAVVSDSGVHLFAGDGAGLQPPAVFPLDGIGRGLAIGDFDLDGSPDIAAFHDREGSGLRMLVYTWSPSEETLAATLEYGAEFVAPGRATSGDVNGDAIPDVVLATQDVRAPLILLPGQGDITFSAPLLGVVEVPASRSNVPLLSDLDGDRRDDLVLLLPGADVLMARSLGTDFDEPLSLELTATAVDAGDVDRDGDVDLVASVDGKLIFLRNRGDGRFARPVVLREDVDAVALLLQDLDGDFRLDLAFVRVDGTVDVARAAPVTP